MLWLLAARGSRGCRLSDQGLIPFMSAWQQPTSEEICSDRHFTVIAGIVINQVRQHTLLWHPLGDALLLCGCQPPYATVWDANLCLPCRCLSLWASSMPSRMVMPPYDAEHHECCSPHLPKFAQTGSGAAPMAHTDICRFYAGAGMPYTGVKGEFEVVGFTNLR